MADLLSLDVSPDTTVHTLKETIQAESHIPATSQHLYHNGQLLADASKTMQQLQVVDGDMLALHVRDMSNRQPTSVTADQRARNVPVQRSGGGNQPDTETIRLRMLGDPNFRQQAAANYPDLVSTMQDPVAFARAYHARQDQENVHRQQVADQIARLNADPFDVDAQLRIEEMIRVDRVQENLQNAIEHNPEGKYGLVSLDDRMLNTGSFWKGSYALY